MGRGATAVMAVLALAAVACGRERWAPTAAPAQRTPPPAASVPTLPPLATGSPTASASPSPAPSAAPSPSPTPFDPYGGCVTDLDSFPTGTIDPPKSLAQGHDGALWFAAGREIGRMTRDGKVRRFALPEDVRSFSIANGFAGELWFTDQGTTAIGRISPSGAVRMFPTPTRQGNPIGVGGAANPYSITKGPDGAMWFTESAADRIGRIDPQGRITEYKLPSYSRVHANPQGVVLGPDDRLWFVQPLDGSVAAFDPKTKQFSEYDLPWADALPSDITIGPGVVFVADPHNGIGRVKTDGEAKLARMPSADQEVWQVGGRAYNAWYLETKRGTIGQIDPDGSTHTVATVGKGRLGVEAHPSIIRGPDATWFVESQVRKLARVMIACP